MQKVPVIVRLVIGIDHVVVTKIETKMGNKNHIHTYLNETS